jgi:cellulose synthase/poly-beta-1,6-N-acetylglucosamine synthase-like glycosyltransferase
MNHKVSIIVPCLDEENYIDENLTSLINSDYPTDYIEILVVDGGSTDRSLEIIRRFQEHHNNIILLNNPKKITPVSLNMGIIRSTGDYIMIASAHSKFPQNYISSLIKTLIKMNCDCIGGAIETRSISNTKVASAITKVLSSGFGVGNSSFRTKTDEIMYVDTVPFGIYRKSVYKEVGLYNEELVRNHDIEFSKRLIKAGYKIVLDASVRCEYYARETYRKLSFNNFSNGFWNLITFYTTRRLGSLSLRHFIPLIFILSLLVSCLAAILIDSRFVFLSLVILLLYVVFISFAAFRINNKSGIFVYILICFPVLHFSYGIGSLIGLLRIDKILLKRT